MPISLGLGVGISRVGANSQFVGIADKIATAPSAAYGLRRLRGAYAGPLIQAKLTGGTTQDIGFLSNGELDTVSLLAFAAGAEARVTIWYDQMGNSNNNILQATFANIPRICTGGVVDTSNSKPAVFFDVARQCLWPTTSTPFSTSSATCTAATAICYAVSNTGSNNGVSFRKNRSIFSEGNEDVGMVFLDNGVGTTQYIANINGTLTQSAQIAVTFPVTGCFTMRYSGGSTFNNATINGGAETASGSAPPAGTVITNGVWCGSNSVGDTTSRMDGFIGEMLWYNKTLSKADLNTLGTSMAARFSQTWTTIP